MKKSRVFALVFAITAILPTALLLGSGIALGAGVNAATKVAVHVLPHRGATRTCAETQSMIGRCEDIRTEECEFDVDAFPVFFDIAEFRRLDYGLTWKGSSTCIFTSCSDHTIGNIQHPGDGITHIWDTCQRGPVVIPGWAQISGQGRVCVVKHPAYGAIRIQDCGQNPTYDEPLAVFCAGIGNAEGDDACQSFPPKCQVTPTLIDFGDVPIGTYVDRTFVIRNVGGGVLKGEVLEVFPYYSIVSGGGKFSLGIKDSLVVRVRFAPTQTGFHRCVVYTGTECATVTCRGTGVIPPACSVSPVELVFGDVLVGGSVERRFVIRNVGGGVLRGEVSEDCDEFEIITGRGSYALSSGESLVVVVRYTPQDAGGDGCLIGTGSLCADVRCVGSAYLPPACSVSPVELVFGDVLVGGSVERSFVIRNVGGGVLEGEVSEGCGEFEIVSGGGSYALGSGESREVVVRYSPEDVGGDDCLIGTGSLCADVRCVGSAYLPPVPPACSVSPVELVFGDVLVGGSVERSFVIRNVGGGVLEGEVSEGCGEFEIVSGGGSYALGSGESREVVVRYSPEDVGGDDCLIGTGSLCADVRCVGSAYLPPVPPACSVSPVELVFGDVLVGGSVERSFVIRNVGGGVLRGEVSEDCDEFEIISGAGAYSLSHGESVEVTVRYSPIDDGEDFCAVLTGSDCQTVSLRGKGLIPAICDVNPQVLDFGTVTIGDSKEMSFFITNVGGGRLKGTVEIGCAEFSVVDGRYNLGRGESKEIKVIYEPINAGGDTCEILTGSICDAVVCIGVGDLPPACSVSPVELDFGDVLVGGSVERSFVIRNVGGGVLEGEVSEGCDGFEIVSGGGFYSLGGGDSLVVVVRFEPGVGGDYVCELDAGLGCGEVRCIGHGVGPECVVEPEELGFGIVLVGNSVEASFVIRNVGGGVLEGEVREDCDEFEIVSGGGTYSLSHGQSIEVTVRYSPIDDGFDRCSVSTGTECEAVVCRGIGYGCHGCCIVVPTYLDFGTITVGASKDLSFMILNNWGGLLQGTISENCEHYRIISGEGDFSLASGEILTVVVRFEPTSEGVHDCIIETGPSCMNVRAHGVCKGYPLPICEVEPTRLEFSNTKLGQSADLTFVIRNAGGGILQGQVGEACDEFEITSGGGSYSLASGESLRVTVRYSPVDQGSDVCVVTTGTQCDNVTCIGQGEQGSSRIYVDIKPGSCPNSLNPRGTELCVLPVAILGTELFDVRSIVPSSVRMYREGVGEAVEPIRYSYEDVATPFKGNLCDCHTLGGDSYEDLSFKFDLSSVANKLELADVAGQTVPVIVSATLRDGSTVRGSDCIRVLGTKENARGVGFISASMGAGGKNKPVEISFYTESPGILQIGIYDVLGRKVCTIANEVPSSGIYQMKWDGKDDRGRDVEPGIYLARMEKDGGSATIKLVVVK